MPYIKPADRAALEKWPRAIEDAGELNYMITQLIMHYVKQHSRPLLRYWIINDVVGALEGAKAEFQRRVVGPYEDQKCKENGDVY